MRKNITKFVAIIALTVLVALCGCGGKKTEITGINVPVPDSFVKSTETSVDMWMAPDYPTDGSNVVLTVTDSDPAGFSAINSDLLESQTEQMYLSSYGADIDVNITSFERTEIDGEEVIKVVMEYSYNGINCKQLEYMVNGSENAYFAVYTQIGDADWFDAFETCGDGITFERK